MDPPKFLEVEITSWDSEYLINFVGMDFTASLQILKERTGFESRRRQDVCKCIVPLRFGDTLNSRRAASPLVWLVEAVERWEAAEHPGVLPQIGVETS
ncbi:hypothetical protein TNCV_1228341 [Trichonephila clavipes]|nr:hypothetical protein TNCV_1228341 [Trichonephila clavipes]